MDNITKLREQFIPDPEFQYLTDRKDKIELIYKKLRNLIDTFNIHNYHDEAYRKSFFLETSILIESIILYANSSFDVLIKLVNQKIKNKIQREKILNKVYQRTIINDGNVQAHIVDLASSKEFHIVRKIANLIKHEKLIKTGLVIYQKGERIDFIIEKVSIINICEKELSIGDIMEYTKTIFSRVSGIVTDVLLMQVIPR